MGNVGRPKGSGKKAMGKTISQMKKSTSSEPSKYDKYLDCLNGSKKWEDLSKVEFEMYDKYSLAWSMANIGRTDDMIEAALMKKFDIKAGMARIIRIESFELFGSTNEINKQGRKIAAINYFKMLSNLARTANDYKTATVAWKEASTLEGLYEGENAGWDMSKFNLPPTMIFTSDVNVLINQRNELEADE